MSSGLIGFLSFFSFFFFFLCWKDSAGPIVFYWPNTLRPETLPWLSQKNQDPLVAACLESALSSYYSLPYPGLSHLGLQGDLVVTRLHPHCWASGKHRPKLSSLSGPGRQARRGLDGCWVSQCLVSINITVFETKEARNHLVSDEPILKVNCFPWLWREIWLKKKKKQNSIVWFQKRMAPCERKRMTHSFQSYFLFCITWYIFEKIADGIPIFIKEEKRTLYLHLLVF